MPGRRQSAADLPRAPLELVHPLEIQGGAVAGAEILSDGLGPTAVLLFRLHRALLAWTLDPESPPAADRAELRRIEDAVLSRLRKDEIAAPLAVLTAALLDPEAADPKRLSWACLCISDWAIARGAKSAAVAYAQLAALSWPRHARYAWVVGRLLRGSGRVRESEPWFKRAHRVAVWTDDWEAQTLTLNSLGNLHRALGRYRSSKRLLLRGLRLSRRKSLRTLEGEISHDLFVLHAEMGEVDVAERFAADALVRYGATHPRLRMLAHDVAQFWTERGCHWRTLPLFIALLPRFKEPNERARVLAGAARAAAAAGDPGRFERFRSELTGIADEADDLRALAGAFYEVGIGATMLGDCRRAMEMFERARTLAELSAAADIATKADLALEGLRARDCEPVRQQARELDMRLPGDKLAYTLVQVLESGLQVRS